MNFKKKEKEIDGIKFITVKFPAYEALKLHRKLLQLLAPSITTLAGLLNTQKDENSGIASILDIKIDEKAITSITSALIKLLDQLPEDQFLKLLQELLQYTTSIINIPDEQGKNVKEKLVSFSDWSIEIFNIVFSDNPFTVYKVIAFVLEVNFPGFFDKISSIGS